MTTHTTDTPRVYVACLASYNAGILHGRWIDADTSAEQIQTEIEGMLAESPEHGAEEWAIHDYECFCGLSLGEYTPTETVAEYARLIAEHGAAYALYAQNCGLEYASEDDFPASYCGEWDSEQDYADYLAEQLYGADDSPLWVYFDFERFARDLFCGDYWSDEDESGMVHVFSR